MDADFRAERRRFILAAHPDRGGDTAEFAAGLRHFDDQRHFDDRRQPAAATHTADTFTATEGPDGNWPVSLLSLVLRGIRERRR